MRAQIVLAGVGGQGVLFATKVFAAYARSAGDEVMASETHGMAQRGGSVTSHLKVGGFNSSLVRTASADFLFSFNCDETLRNMHFIKPGGTVFVNALDAGFIPSEIASDLEKNGITVKTVDADGISTELGAPLSANLVLLGFAAACGGMDADLFKNTVSEISPGRFRDKNLAAFQAGADAAEK